MKYSEMDKERAESLRAYYRSIYIKKKDLYRKRSIEWRKNNLERSRELARKSSKKKYKIDGLIPDKVLARRRATATYTKKWRSRHREKYLESCKKQNERKKLLGLRCKNRQKIKEYHAQKSRDPQYRIARANRSRIYYALKNKTGKPREESSLKLLGCSVAQFKIHLESQFKPGMTWENQGEWHIDHIIPCSSFDLSNHDDRAKCFHFSNMRPLWAVENLRKGSKIETPCLH